MSSGRGVVNFQDFVRRNGKRWLPSGFRPPTMLAMARKRQNRRFDVKRYYLVIFQSGYRKDSLGGISDFLFWTVQKELAARIDSPPERSEIDVWLESSGGDPNMAYKLVLELRHYCRRLRAVVPDYAKSAATLFALGTEEIYMAPAAELGPLDAQIPHPEKENMTISALGVSQSLASIGDFAVEYIVSGGRVIVEWTQLTRSEVLREFSTFTAHLLQPVVCKLDPHTYHTAANELELAKRYGIKLLETRRVSFDEQEGDDPDAAASRIADTLVSSYPSHDFAISRDEATSLGLAVFPWEQYDRRDEIRQLHDLFRTGTGESRVELLTEEDLHREFYGEKPQHGFADNGDEFSGRSGQFDGKRVSPPRVPGKRSGW